MSDTQEPPAKQALFKFERTIGWPELIALAALAASSYAVLQSREANSPRVAVTALPARSYLVCQKDTGEFHARNAALFRITNNGGRATTFVGLSPADSIEPVTAYSDGKEIPKAWYALHVLDKLETSPDGFDSPSWALEPVFTDARQLVLREREGGNLRA